MTSFPLRLPEDLKEAAAEQAARTGVSLNQYIAVALAGRVAAQAEAERYFAARGKRAIPGRAKAILAKAGQDNPPRPDDQLPD
ncbi:MAG TPA: toxin-antitoxin system HicB family antitoxin [Azospirillaceae bacterium]|nr:toxin-antitoxin system HicB family antitoxin [Azospirillaceae bacterium]